jgi:hypothetical protein
MNFNKKNILFLAIAIAAILVALKLTSGKKMDPLPKSATQTATRLENQHSSNADKPLNSAGESAAVDPLPTDPNLAAAELEKRRELAIEKMHEASISYDAAELPVIQPYLESPDPQLRAAAVDAMVVLGDASAGPMLRDAAKKLKSEEEAKKMEKAADYIELPPASVKDISENMKKIKDAKKAEHQKPK